MSLLVTDDAPAVRYHVIMTNTVTRRETRLTLVSLTEDEAKAFKARQPARSNIVYGLRIR